MSHRQAGEVTGNRGIAGQRGKRSVDLMMSSEGEVLRDTMLKNQWV